MARVSSSRDRRLQGVPSTQSPLTCHATTQKHHPSLRLIAVHSLIDAILTTLVVLCFALVTLSSPSHLGRRVCEHLSRGDALLGGGIVASPGSGLESCEEKFAFGIAPVLFLLGGIAVYVRVTASAFIWSYYRAAHSAEGRICLESPTSTPKSSYEYPSSSAGRRRAGTAGAATHSASSQQHQAPPLPGRHSRSSSASTVRPKLSFKNLNQPASRIMLLPSGFDASGYRSPLPHLNVIPPSPIPSSNSSTDSFETIKGPGPGPAPPSAQTTRRRSMSHDSTDSVIVYAPILMTISEAQSLGGREAVIASSATASSSSSRHQRTGSSSPRHRTTSPPATAPINRAVPSRQSAPFAAVKGFRDSTELESFQSSVKSA